MDKKFPQSWKISSGSDGMTGSFLMSEWTLSLIVPILGLWYLNGSPDLTVKLSFTILKEISLVLVHSFINHIDFSTKSSKRYFINGESPWGTWNYLWWQKNVLSEEIGTPSDLLNLQWSYCWLLWSSLSDYLHNSWYFKTRGRIINLGLANHHFLHSD